MNMVPIQLNFDKEITVFRTEEPAHSTADAVICITEDQRSPYRR